MNIIFKSFTILFILISNVTLSNNFSIARSNYPKINNYLRLEGKGLITTIPLKIHIIRMSDGTGGLDSSLLPSLINSLNNNFAQSGLQFLVVGSIHYIHSNRYYNLSYLENASELYDRNNVDDAVNIYITSFLTAGNSIPGLSYPPSGSRIRNNIVVNTYSATSCNGLSHYLGLYFGLLRTQPYTPNQELELVNGSNCTTTGDFICDTPADPGCCYNSSNCTYTGTSTDANGQQFNPLINNIMSDYLLCRTTFTNGQYAKIQSGYNQRVTLMNSSGQYNYNTEISVNAPSNIRYTPLGCNLSLSWSDNANNEMGYIIESSNNPTGPFVSIGRVNKNVTSFIDTRSLTNGVPYYYRIIAANSRATYSDTIGYISSNSTLCYCKVISSDCSTCYINNVKVWEGDNVNVNKIIINQGSYCLSGGYSYFNNNPPIFEIGKEYRISISLTNNFSTSRAKCWIDFNRDAIFSNDEMVYSSPQFTPNTIRIPLNASEGNLRMRIRQQEYVYPIDACSEFYDGETEDYEIIIKKSCSQSINATGNINTNLSTNEFINTFGTNIISPVNNVVYNGKKYVELNPGFNANPNTGYYFSVVNTGCPE